MNYVHGIFVVNRPDLLELALHSVRPFWPFAFILDNSPGGHIGMDNSWPIPVIRPSVPLSYAQSMNYLFQIAGSKGADVFGVQHNDAEAPEGGAEQFLGVVSTAFASARKWAAVFTHYDIISAYNIQAVRAIGEWDSHFPQPNYHVDVDWFHRARTQGYELIESHVPVKHHGGSSNTIKADPALARINSITFGMNEVYYAQKWGGRPHEERFASPWSDRPAS